VEFSVTIGYAISIRHRLICRYCDYTPAGLEHVLEQRGKSISLIRCMRTRRGEGVDLRNRLCAFEAFSVKQAYTTLLLAFVCEVVFQIVAPARSPVKAYVDRRRRRVASRSR